MIFKKLLDMKKILVTGKRYWIPAIGWFLFLGFFNNCVLAPYLDIKTVEWSHLLTALAVMLSISGARDIGLKKQPDDKTTKVDGKVGSLGKRYWIVAIGWALAMGYFNNCMIYPYFDIDPVEWPQLLTGLGVMLGISGTRDIFLNRNKKIVEKVAEAVNETADETETDEAEFADEDKK